MNSSHKKDHFFMEALDFERAARLCPAAAVFFVVDFLRAAGLREFDRERDFFDAEDDLFRAEAALRFLVVFFGLTSSISTSLSDFADAEGDLLRAVRPLRVGADVATERALFATAE